MRLIHSMSQAKGLGAWQAVHRMAAPAGPLASFTDSANRLQATQWRNWFNEMFMFGKSSHSERFFLAKLANTLHQSKIIIKCELVVP